MLKEWDMAEVAGITMGILVGVGLIETGRRALLGARLQRSMSALPTPMAAGPEARPTS